jgi:hypothetical protein
VMSRIMPAFCSSVRPAAMLTVISGILVTPFSFATSLLLRNDPHPEERTSCARLEGCASCPHGSRRRKSASSP